MGGTGGRTAQRRLADWGAALTWGDIPPDVRATAIRAVVDTISVAIAAEGRPSVVRAARAVNRSTGGWATAADAPILAARPLAGADPYRPWLPLAQAALVSATAAHALDWDDTCFAGVVHGSAVILPTASVVGQARRASMQDLLTAFVAGSEVAYAIGAAFGDRLYDAGWFPSPMLGAPGAAVAAGKLLGFDGERTARALGLVLPGAAAFRTVMGTDAKPLLLGRAAAAGVEAAQLVAAGATAPLDVLEADNGLLRLLGHPAPDRSARSDAVDIGRVWRLADPGLVAKRWPVCSSAQPAMEAVLKAMAAADLAPGPAAAAAIDRIDLAVAPMVVASLPFDRPETPEQAMFSLPYAIACAVVGGGMAPGDLAGDRLRDPVRVGFMARVSWRIEALAGGSGGSVSAPEAARATVAIRREGGGPPEKWERRVDRAAGHPGAPLDLPTLRRKAGPARWPDSMLDLLTMAAS